MIKSKFKTLSNYQLGHNYAKKQDNLDELSDYRNQFHIPKDNNGKELIYLTGNSLGLQPKSTKKYINQELDDWANLGVEGHTEAKNPWLPYHEFLTESMANLVGCKTNRNYCNEYTNCQSSFYDDIFLSANKNTL